MTREQAIEAAGFEAVAIEAAQRAGAIVARRYASLDDVRVEYKGPQDLVTEVDREAEAEILRFLGERCPAHAIVSEESAPEVREADFRWVIDPIDGTTNFVHGIPCFSVSVGLEDRQGIVAGAVFDPLRQETFSGCRDGGARLNGRAIRSSQTPSLTRALLATGFPPRERARADEYLVAFGRFLDATSGWFRRGGSAALDLAYVACGRYDGFWEIGLSRWDMVAGTLLVREAGGRVSDLAGGDTHLDTGDIVAAAARVHPEMLEITRAAFR